MQRRILAALSAFVLAMQAGGALAACGAFFVEEHVCCCAARGMTGEHHCECPECARRSRNESGACSLGGCTSDSGPLAPGDVASVFLPLAEGAQALAPRVPPPETAADLPPPAIALDVPTPPPLA